MSFEFEREFFSLVAWFLIARGSIMAGHSIVDQHPQYSDFGCWTGMCDNAIEMQLLLREVMAASSLHLKREGMNSVELLVLAFSEETLCRLKVSLQLGSASEQSVQC